MTDDAEQLPSLPEVHNNPDDGSVVTNGTDNPVIITVRLNFENPEVRRVIGGIDGRGKEN